MTTAYQHVYEGAGAPTYAPSSIGAHYTNTDNGDQYLAKGTASEADWELQEKAGAGAAAVSAHEQAANPHSQYAASAAPAAAVAAHTQEADPHTQYQQKEAGKGLSSNDYTASEKAKLAALEGSHFKGAYVDLSALTAAVPAPAAGDYADVDAGAGSDVVRYVWDASDADWKPQLGVSAQLTAAQVKTLYESNPDTNDFSDAEKAKLAAMESGLGVGDVLYSLRSPGSKFVMPGQVYLQSAYPALYQLLGLIEAGDVSTANWAAQAALGFGNGTHNVVATDGYGVWLIGGPTAGSLLLSQDDGATWQLINTGMPNNITNLTTDGSWNWLATDNETGILWRSTDNGLTWASVSVAGMASAVVDVFLASNGVAIAVGYSGKLARSSDHGATWTAVTSGFSATNIYAIRTDGAGNWVALGWYGKSSYSTDDGVTFTLTPSTPLGTTNMATLDTDKAGVWVAASAESSKIARSTNNGQTWTVLTGILPALRRLRCIGNSEWLGFTSDGQIWRSTDNGLTWVKTATLSSGSMGDVAAASSGTIIGVIYYGDYLLLPAASYPYDAATQFKTPAVDAPAGATAYIKAVA